MKKTIRQRLCEEGRISPLIIPKKILEEYNRDMEKAKRIYLLKALKSTQKASGKIKQP